MGADIDLYSTFKLQEAFRIDKHMKWIFFLFSLRRKSMLKTYMHQLYSYF